MKKLIVLGILLASQLSSAIEVGQNLLSAVVNMGINGAKSVPYSSSSTSVSEHGHSGNTVTTNTNNSSSGIDIQNGVSLGLLYQRIISRDMIVGAQLNSNKSFGFSLGSSF